MAKTYKSVAQTKKSMAKARNFIAQTKKSMAKVNNSFSLQLERQNQFSPALKPVFGMAEIGLVDFQTPRTEVLANFQNSAYNLPSCF